VRHKRLWTKIEGIERQIMLQCLERLRALQSSCLSPCRYEEISDDEARQKPFLAAKECTCMHAKWSPSVKIKAISRDASSDKAKALASKGVEVFQGDLSDKASLVQVETSTRFLL
jgi:hypothetical protein